MPQKFYIISLILFGLSSIQAQNSQPIDYIQMSQDFVYEVKTDGNATPYLDSFAIADENILEEQLKTIKETRKLIWNT